MKKPLIISAVIIIIIVLSVILFKSKAVITPPQVSTGTSTTTLKTTLQGPSKVSKTTTANSMTGTLAVTGSMPLTDLIIKTADNQVAKLEASPEIYAMLSRLSGIVISINGQNTLTGGGFYKNIFTVTSFKAISSNGIPVEDGIIITDNKGNLLLQTDHGNLALPNPPAAFRTKVGARVFVGVPLDNPLFYGFITTP